MMRWQSPLRRMMGYLTNLLTTDMYNTAENHELALQAARFAKQSSW